MAKMLRILELLAFAALLLWLALLLALCLWRHDERHVNCVEIPTETGPWFITESWR